MQATYRQPITPPAGKVGFFEITFRIVKPGKPMERGTCLLEARGFQAAKEAFDALGLGEYGYARQISEAAFRAAQGRATA
jgi:hypothetical protein